MRTLILHHWISPALLLLTVFTFIWSLFSCSCHCIAHGGAHYCLKQIRSKLLQIEHQQGDDIFGKKTVVVSFLFKLIRY
jgi:hypothetical protein